MPKWSFVIILVKMREKKRETLVIINWLSMERVTKHYHVIIIII